MLELNKQQLARLVREQYAASERIGAVRAQERPLLERSLLRAVQSTDEGLRDHLSTFVGGSALDTFRLVSNAFLFLAISLTDFPVPIYYS